MTDPIQVEPFQNGSGVEWSDWAAEQRGPGTVWWQTATVNGQPLMRISRDSGKTWHLVSGCRMPEWA